VSTKTNLALDLIMFGGILAVANPRLTGTTIHEWLALSLAGAVLTHLLLHWEWVIRVGKDFLKKLFHQSRLNFVVNVLFFITMTGALFSGLMISQSVMSTLGLQLPSSPAWRSLHRSISDAAVIVLGLHVALHLKWLGSTLKRYVLQPAISLFANPAPAPAPASLSVQRVDVRERK
jgi:hypothetical protein